MRPIFNNKNIFLKMVLGGVVAVHTVSGYSESIKIQAVDGRVFDCHYNELTFKKGEIAKLVIDNDDNNIACTIGRPPSVQDPILPAPIYPVSVVQSSRPEYYSWVALPGVTEYKIKITKGGEEIQFINIDEQKINQICSSANSSDGSVVCKYADRVLYYGVVSGYTLVSGTDYHWSVRVKSGTGDIQKTYFNQVENGNFVIEAPIVSAEKATESHQQFETQWSNLYYNPLGNPTNNYSSKDQLKDLIGRGTGYQELNNGDKVYIINQSHDIETIIPSCVNGQRYSFNDSQCLINDRFEQGEIYALRLRTKDVYTVAEVTKDTGQLYNGQGANYNITLSRFPGEMIAGSVGDFTGNCSSVTFYGSFSIDVRSTAGIPSSCHIPPASDVYVNIKLQDNQNMCDTVQCQIDIIGTDFYRAPKNN